MKYILIILNAVKMTLSSNELGNRPVDSIFNKAEAAKRYTKPVKYYITYLENVRKNAYKRKAPFMFERRCLTTCQKSALATLIDFARKSEKKEHSVAVID